MRPRATHRPCTCTCPLAPVGLAFDDVGSLWGVENGADNLWRADLGGDIHADNPGEELNRLDAPGAFYGYPYCWSEHTLPARVASGPGAQWAWPSFMSSGVTDDWCRAPANVRPPSLVMQAHTAPLGIAFLTADVPCQQRASGAGGNGGVGAFPCALRGHAFVAQHGSWNRPVPVGYAVVRVPFDAPGGAPVGDAVPLLSHEGAGAQWPSGLRPVDVVFSRSGTLLISSDTSGQVIQIRYNPPPSPSPPPPPPPPPPSPPPHPLPPPPPPPGTSTPVACMGVGGAAGSDPAGWSVELGLYPFSATLTAGVELDGEIMVEGTLAAFIGSETRGVQQHVTLVPDLPLAGRYAGLAVWALSVLGNPPDDGRTARFEYSHDGKASHALVTTYTWAVSGVKGNVFQPFVVHGSTRAPATCWMGQEGYLGARCSCQYVWTSGCPHPVDTQLFCASDAG